MATHPPAIQREIEVLYTDHNLWLQGWLRRRLDNACDASDLAQDVFMKLLRRGEPIQARAPRAFLATVARGLVVEHWRRRELETAWLQTLATLREAEAPSPETRLQFLEALIQIDRMLDAMKPTVRQAFLLAQLDGLTCPQIAQRLSVSLSTVERYIAKALRGCYALQFES